MRKPSGKPGQAHQRVLEAAQVLESNIERLKSGVKRCPMCLPL